MERQHGITADTYRRIVLDAGQLRIGYVNEANPGALLAATRGGSVFAIDTDIRKIPVDGGKGDIRGDKRIAGVSATITARIVELSAWVISLATAGAAVTDAAPHYQVARFLSIALSKYRSSIALIGQVSGTDELVICRLENVIGTKGLSVAMVDGDESVLEAVFTAHFDPATMDSEPWSVRAPKEPSELLAAFGWEGNLITDPITLLEEIDGRMYLSTGASYEYISPLLYSDDGEFFRSCVVDFSAIEGESSIFGSVQSITKANGIYYATGYQYYINNEFLYSILIKSTDGLNWVATSVDAVNEYYYNISSSDSGLVAVCGNSNTGAYTLKYSTNAGATWGNSAAPTFSEYSRFIFDGTKFYVAKGNLILSSVDGASWATVLTGAFSVYTLCYGNGKIIAVGEQGEQYVSANGIDWGAVVGSVASFNSVFTGGKFVTLYDDSGTTRIAYSVDGETWTTGAESPFAFDYYYIPILFFADKYLIGGSIYSYDYNGDIAKLYTTTNLSAAPTEIPIKGIDISPLADYNFPVQLVNRSTGQTSQSWGAFRTAQKLTHTTKLNDMIFIVDGDPQFSDFNRLNYSDDGIKFYPAIFPEADYYVNKISSLAWNGTKYIATGSIEYTHDIYYQSNAYFISDDGITWAMLDAPINQSEVEAVVGAVGATFIYAMGRLGEEPNIWTSTDGINWTLQHTGLSGESYFQFARSGTTAVIVGTDDSGLAAIYASTDLETWTKVYSYESAFGIQKIASDGTNLVATSETNGFSYQVYISADGINWTRIITVPLQEIYSPAISFANGKFILSESQWDYVYESTLNIYLYSSDDFGNTWDNVATLDKLVSGVIYLDGGYLASGSRVVPVDGYNPQYFGNIGASADLETWGWDETGVFVLLESTEENPMVTPLPYPDGTMEPAAITLTVSDGGSTGQLTRTIESYLVNGGE